MTRFFHNTRHFRGSRVPIKSIKLLLSFLAGLFIISCEEDPTIIGKELLPATDFVLIESTDTISPLSFTMYDDSISTENPSTSYLGQTWDPYFGTTSAGFVSQLRLKEDWDGKAFTIDSTKLMLRLAVHGGRGGTHTLNINEIAQDLSTTGKYYSNTEVPLDTFKLDIPLPAMPEDSTSIISVKVPDRFANRILADTSKLFHSNKVPDFRSYFKGLYFKLSSTGEPMMTFLSLAHSGSENGTFIIDRFYSNFFVIYLHDSAGNKKEFYLILDAVNRNASFNLFSHDFTTADKPIQHYNNTSYRDTLTYLQSLNGVYTRLVFPGLEAIKKSGNLKNTAVNKARLTIPFFSDENLYDVSKAPPYLYLRYRRSDGIKPFVQDFNIDENHYFYDGRVDTTKRIYNFNIATFVQAYLEDESGKILPELELVQASGTNNLILRANSNIKTATFDFTYTRF